MIKKSFRCTHVNYIWKRHQLAWGRTAQGDWAGEAFHVICVSEYLIQSNCIHRDVHGDGCKRSCLDIAWSHGFSSGVGLGLLVRLEKSLLDRESPRSPSLPPILAPVLCFLAASLLVPRVHQTPLTARLYCQGQERILFAGPSSSRSTCSESCQIPPLHILLLPGRRSLSAT